MADAYTRLRAWEKNIYDESVPKDKDVREVLDELDSVKKDLKERELHHFETEQILTRIKAYVKFNEKDHQGWVDASDILSFIGGHV